jgi:hypothetical protein
MTIDYRIFFKGWKDWEEFEPRIDDINGIYAFRLKTPFARLVGKSDILYIGKVEQNSKINKRPGIWHRLKNYRQHNLGASKRLKDIELYFGGKSSIEYSYVLCTDPRQTESELLKSYYEQHLEFPPLNRSS